MARRAVIFAAVQALGRLVQARSMAPERSHGHQFTGQAGTLMRWADQQDQEERTKRHRCLRPALAPQFPSSDGSTYLMHLAADAMVLFCIVLRFRSTTTGQLKRAEALAGVWVSHLSTHVR
jgi:hypothetical protein